MSFLESYLFLNIILAIGFSLVFFSTVTLKNKIKNLSSEQILKIHYSALVFSILTLLLVRFAPGDEFVFPVSQKFSSAVTSARTSLAEVTYTPLSVKKKKVISYGGLLEIILLSLILFNVFRLFFGAVKTHRHVKKGFLYKKLGKLSVYLDENSITPFAFSYFNRSYISLPTGLLQDAKNFMISSKHELQHIRHKDTVFAYVGALLKAIFFLNPAIFYWIKTINLEQEFSCDERVILKRGVLEQDYKNCLYKVATLGRGCDLNLVGATGFFSGSSHSELIRRIKMMSDKKSKIRKSVLAAVLTALVSVLSFSAYAFNKHAGLGKLEAAAVMELILNSGFSKDFPVDLNDEVVSQVNRLIRSTKGKKHSRLALANYAKHQKEIQEIIARYDLPKEIAAVAFVESAFTNPKQKQGRPAAGMWQFIYQTADAYGLVVDGVDKRRDITAATDAAMRYLESLNLRFGDLRLAMLSYNAGENAVFNVMKKTKSRDPWVVMANGLNYDKGYLAKVMAAAIVMKNPDLLK